MNHYPGNLAEDEISCQSEEEWESHKQDGWDFTEQEIEKYTGCASGHRPEKLRSSTLPDEGLLEDPWSSRFDNFLILLF